MQQPTNMLGEQQVFPDTRIVPLSHRTLVQRIRSGEPLAGTMSFTQSEVVIEAMAQSGLDFVILDAEHCPLTLEGMARLIRAADAVSLPALVRFARVDPHMIQVALDVGAAGIVISVVEQVEEVESLVKSVRYRPLGYRGVFTGRRGSFENARRAEVMKQHNEWVLTIAIVETATGLESVEKFAAVDGLDVIFLGAGDLSNTFGIPSANFDHPLLSAALDRTKAAAARGGKRMMVNVLTDPEYVKRIFSRGISMFCYSTDSSIFYSACKRIRQIQDNLSAKD